MDFREQFPVLRREVYGRKLVYFDNAATMQKPDSVIEMQARLSRDSNANVHRAVHRLSSEATDLYEAGREAVRTFIGAEDRGNIILTSGATASLNLLATSFSQRYFTPGSKVLVSLAEHHSNIVPWQMACQRTGAVLEVIPVNGGGEIGLEELEKRLDGSVKIISVAHISNVLGVVNPVREITALAHSRGIPVAVDGSQGIVHEKVDVKDIGCDFYAFSGHKIYAPTGTGVLYGKKELLEEMPPVWGGGEMVDTVTFEHTTYAGLPVKFEAGTPNFTGAACFVPALKAAEEAVMDPDIVPFLAEELQKIEGLKIYGLPDDLTRKAPLFSFTVEGAHPEDMAHILDKLGIAVRSGLMCAEPLIRTYSSTGMLRASIAPYNTMEECEYFIRSLRKVIGMLR